MLPLRNPLYIGYLRLQDLVPNLDPTQPVYVAPIVESTSGSIPEQRNDHHYVMVTQLDALNHIHYCRISVVQLVYHNEIPFAPDYREELGRVEAVRSVVEKRLAGEGYSVQAGMVALPVGISLIGASFVEIS